MAFTQDELKQQVAKAAIEYVKSGIIGVVLICAELLPTSEINKPTTSL